MANAKQGCHKSPRWGDKEREMSEEKWIVYCESCQSLEKKLTLLESERDRLRKENEDFKEHTDNLQFLINKKNVERDRLSTELIHAQATICDMEDKEIGRA